jgi:hypothetical protein
MYRLFGETMFDPERERRCVAIEDTLAVLGKLIDEGKIGISAYRTRARGA